MALQREYRISRSHERLVAPIKVHVLRGWLVGHQQTCGLGYPVPWKIMRGVIIRVRPVPRVSAHDQSATVLEELDDFLVIRLVIAVPELRYQAIQSSQVIRVGACWVMALGLQLIGECIEPSTYSEPDVGIWTADPFDRPQCEGKCSLVGIKIDPGFMSVPNHLPLSDMGPRNHWNFIGPRYRDGEGVVPHGENR